jgi:hypothetical protein
MKSSWPVLLAVLGLTIGAFIYDAHNADAAASRARATVVSIAP